MASVAVQPSDTAPAEELSRLLLIALNDETSLSVEGDIYVASRSWPHPLSLTLSLSLSL